MEERRDNEGCSTTLEEEARLAVEGSRAALERLIRALQEDVYLLSLRMLGNREDAEDATQEILVRVATRLSQFDFRSKLKTWVYRVAVNYILDLKKSASERMYRSFDHFSEHLVNGLAADGPDETERSVLIEEVKVGCALGMLQCLDRPHRLAFILGEIMEMPGREAAEVLGISPVLFRKRLQQARSAVQSFTRTHCGLVSDTARCRCNRQLPATLRSRTICADMCSLAERPSSFEEARALVRRVDQARRAFAVHHTSRPKSSAIDFARRLVHVLNTLS